MSKPRTNITIARPTEDTPYAHGAFRGRVKFLLTRCRANGIPSMTGFLHNAENDNPLAEEFARETAHATFAETLGIAAQYVTIK